MTRRDRGKRNRRPALERLERRDVPATWGIAWPNAQHLTLSFAPDGTSVLGQSSRLFQALDAQLGAGRWEQTILDAYQTWAVKSNINVGEVNDGGQPLGVAGLAEGDARFGDIRVVAIPLPAGVAAITAPYNPATGTYSGDLILNSNDNFSQLTGYDLFTVALHEAGHSFGFADSSDPSSFMYDVYRGPQSGLGAGATAAIQALYGGPRNVDALDGTPASDDPTRPTDITPLLANPTTAAPVVGDLSTPGDANYYMVKVPAATSSSQGVDIQVQTTGLSQLAPRVVVTNASGWVVATDVAAGPADGYVAVHLAPSLLAQTYKIRVDGPTGDLHAIGSYTLGVAPTNPPDYAIPIASKATPLPAGGASATINSAQQVNIYSFKTPAALPYGVTVQLKAFGIGLVAPQVAVYNAYGVQVGQGTAADPSNPTVSVRLWSPAPNATYTVKVITGTLNAYQFGAYQVAASFAAPTAPAAPILTTPWLGAANLAPTSSNTTLAAAAKLVTPAGYAPGSFFAAMAGISGASTAHYYAVIAPKASQGSYMTVSVQALGSSGFAPWVTVLDKSGNAVPMRVLAQSGGVGVVQVPTTAGASYVIRVAGSGTSASPSGNYYLNATFGAVGSSLDVLAAGTLGTASAAGVASVTAPSTQVYEFALTGSAASTGTDAMLRLTVTNASGLVMATITCLASEAATINVLLGAGTYSVRVEAFSPSGANLPPLPYQLAGTNLTDPIKIASPTGAGGSTTTA